MTVQLPGANPPRWATSPPANTITEPTEPEKDVGFQPGSQAQVDDFVISNVLNNHTYTAQINGVLASFTSPNSGNTAASIGAGLAAAISALGQPVTAVGTSNAARATANVAGQAFTSATTDAANVSIVHVTPNRSGKPIRQYVNWFFNGAYQWLIFWLYTVFQWNDVVDGVGMDVTRQGTPPSTTVGTLSGTSGTAVSFVNTAGGSFVPVRRAVGLSENHLYGASQDTYVDLNFDGSWTYQGVANGAGAPSLAASARRQWRVVTNGVQITSVADLRINAVGAGARPWVFGNFAVNAPPALLSPSSPSGDPQTALAAFVESPLLTYSEIQLGVGTAAPADVRFYLTNFGGLAISVGCYWNNGTARWLFDAAALTSNPSHASLYITDAQGSLFSFTKTVSGATSATSWTDDLSGWDDQATGMFGRIANLGAGLGGTLARALRARIQAVPAGSGTSRKTLLWESLNGGAGMRLYWTHTGTAWSANAAFQIAGNARWDGTNIVQDVAGPSEMLEVSAGGFALLRFPAAGSPQTFADTISGGTWIRQATGGATSGTMELWDAVNIDQPAFPNGITTGSNVQVGALGVSIAPGAAGSINAGGGISSNASVSGQSMKVTLASGTADNTSLYQKNLCKASGTLVADGAGGFSFSELFGCTAAMNGTGRIDVTFAVTMPSTGYTVTYGFNNPQGTPQTLSGTKTTAGFSIRLASLVSPNSFLASFASGWSIEFQVV